MAAANSTTYDAYLKDMWPRKAINNLVLEDNASWGSIQKFTDWAGDKYNLCLAYGDTQGQGPDFNSAQNNKQASLEAKFELTPSTYYSLFSIQRKLIRQSRNDGAVVEALGRQSMSAMNTWKRSNGLFLFGNGGGALGVVSSVSTTSLVLTTAAAVRRFEVGMTLEASTDDGTGASPAGVLPGTVRITAIDEDTRTLTGNVNWSTITGIAATNYLFIAGSYGAVMSGFDAWLPATVTSTSFFGLDRTAHKQRLGGQRVTATGMSPRAAAMRAAQVCWRAGGKPDWYILGTEDFLNLQYDLQSAGALVRTQTPAGKLDGVSFGISYDGIEMLGPAGKITITCDYNCPDGVGWMLTKKTWRLVGLGDFPYFDEMGGGRMQKEANADAYEGRIVGDFQLGCDAPGWNARVTL